MPPMRKFFILLVFFLAISMVIVSFSELQNILETLRKADFRYLLGAFILEVLWMFNLGAMYAAIYDSLGIEDSPRRLFPVVAAVNFVNVVAPSAGVGGVTIFLRDGRRRGYPPGKVTVSSALYVLLDWASVLVVILLGLIVLVRRNNLNASEISAAAFLFLVALFLGVLLYIGSHSEERLGNVLAWLADKINRLLRVFIHRDYLDTQRAHEFAAEMGEGLQMLRQEPQRLLRPMMWALSSKGLLILVFLSTFLAFDVPFSAGTIIGGFAIGYLFLIVSPTPSGVGVVEGVLTVALRSLRVASGAAVVITLSYRAVTFWFPLLVGAVAFHSFSRGEEIPLE